MRPGGNSFSWTREAGSCLIGCKHLPWSDSLTSICSCQWSVFQGLHWRIFNCPARVCLWVAIWLPAVHQLGYPTVVAWCLREHIKLMAHAAAIIDVSEIPPHEKNGLWQWTESSSATQDLNCDSRAWTVWFRFGNCPSYKVSLMQLSNK